MNTATCNTSLLAAAVMALLSAASLADDTATEEASTSPEFWLQPSIKSSSEGGGVGIAARVLAEGTSYTAEVSRYSHCTLYCSTEERAKGDTHSVSLMRGSYTRSGRRHSGYEYGLAYVERDNGNERETYRGLGIPLKASGTLDGYAIGVGLSVELMIAKEPYIAAGVMIPFGKLW